jgi:hypothetical protein
MLRISLAALVLAFLLFVTALTLGYTGNPDLTKASTLIMLFTVPLGLGSIIGLAVALVGERSRRP